MSKGRIWPSEIKEYDDPLSGIHVQQLTDYKGNSHHLYFTNPGWYANGTKLLFDSDRENKTNLFSIELATGEITQLTDFEKGQEPNFLGMCVNPVKDEAYYKFEYQLWAIDLNTMEQRVIGEYSQGFIPSMVNCTSDGAYVCTAEFKDLSDLLRIDYGNGYVGFDETHDEHPTSRIMKVAVDGSGQETIWEEEYWIGHVNTSPTQPNLLTFCHEGPWRKVDNRIWGLDINKGKPWKIRECTEGENVGHEYWYADGETIGYHGTLADETALFGRIKYNNTGFEEGTCSAATGHIHSLDEKLIVGDGWGAKHGTVRLWKYSGTDYDGPFVLCEHKGSFIVQKVHIHPRIDPSGKYVIFTTDWTGYGNVYLAYLPEMDEVENLPEARDD